MILWNTPFELKPKDEKPRLLAYEKETSRRGIRVVFNDCATYELNAEEFAKELERLRSNPDDNH